MIQITPQMRVLVAIESVDGRKGIDSLVRLCQDKLAEDPFSGCVFVFRSRSGTAIRLLTYDSCEQPDYVELMERTTIGSSREQFQLHITGRRSERLQPLQHRGIRAPGRYRHLRSTHHGSRPVQSFALRFEIDCCVPIGRFDARMAEPVTDGHQIDPRT